MKTPIIVAGTGGHAGVVIAALRALGGYDVVGLIERSGATVNEAHGVAVIGSDDTLNDIRARGIRTAAVGIGSAPDNTARMSVFKRLKAAGFDIPPLAHPRSWVAPGVSLTEGSQVMAGAFIQSSAVVGENVLINTGAIVEHDDRIGDHAHIATGVRLGGDVVIGECAFVGLGSCVLQSIHIGAGAVIGAGSVVIADIPAGTTYAGSPARQIGNDVS